MKMEEITLNGKKEKIITKLSDEYKDDKVITLNNTLDNTLDLTNTIKDLKNKDEQDI